MIKSYDLDHFYIDDFLVDLNCYAQWWNSGGASSATVHKFKFEMGFLGTVAKDLTTGGWFARHKVDAEKKSRQALAILNNLGCPTGFSL